MKRCIGNEKYIGKSSIKNRIIPIRIHITVVALISLQFVAN